MLTTNLIDENSYISPRAIAHEFHITVKEVAFFSGLSTNTVAKKSRVQTKASQKRLQEHYLLRWHCHPSFPFLLSSS